MLVAIEVINVQHQIRSDFAGRSGNIEARVGMDAVGHENKQVGISSYTYLLVQKDQWRSGLALTFRIEGSGFPSHC